MSKLKFTWVFILSAVLLTCLVTFMKSTNIKPLEYSIKILEYSMDDKKITQDYTKIKIYTAQDMIKSSKKYPQKYQDCVLTKLEPSFRICVYPGWKDRVVSRAIINKGVFEPFMSNIIYGLVHEYPNALFVDAGANVGIYGLYAAAMGKQVWAIEPQEENIIHVMRSAIMNDMLDNMTFVWNGIDWERREASMTINQQNNGASIISSSNTTNPNQLRVSTVLLSDVFDAIDHAGQGNKGVIMKMDVETYECRSIVGSPQSLKKVTAIVMEWAFHEKLPKYLITCSKEDLEQFFKIMLSEGFSPYKHIRNKNLWSPLPSDMYDSKWNTRKRGNVLWLRSQEVSQNFKDKFISKS